MAKKLLVDTTEAEIMGKRSRAGSPESPDLKKKAPKSSAKHGGRRNGSSRKKGTPNKITADARAAIMAAFSDVGGSDYLRLIAVSHPQVFCSLLGKILPTQTQISGDPNNPLTINRIELVVIKPPVDITQVRSAPKGLLAEIINVNPSRC